MSVTKNAFKCEHCEVIRAENTANGLCNAPGCIGKKKKLKKIKQVLICNRCGYKPRSLMQTCTNCICHKYYGGRACCGSLQYMDVDEANKLNTRMKSHRANETERPFSVAV